MYSKTDRNETRKKRHQRVRRKISGTAELPRLCVYRSLKHIYAQIVDDSRGHTLISASSLDASVRELIAGQDGLDKKGVSKLVGQVVAQRALQAGVGRVVVDRGGYVYTGRVAQVAAGAREAGLSF